MKRTKELSFALKTTLPVLFGYLFLGMAFGLLLSQAGYNALWAFFISLFIYAGSGQFALVSFLSGGMSLLSAAVMTLSINSRHIFYGLSFIEKFKAMGRRGLYMIFSLTDETYSLLCGTSVPKALDEHRALLWIAVCDQLYWILGSVLGALLGGLRLFDASGVEFAMTALFVVIFIDQWQAAKSHLPAYIGAACGAASLVLLGADAFILPAMCASAGLLMLFKKTVQGQDESYAV